MDTTVYRPIEQAPGRQRTRPDQGVRPRRRRGARAGRRRRRLRRRRVHRDHGPVGLGQVDAHALLAGLDRPQPARALGDIEITALDDDALTRLRRDRIGFVFQSFNLLPMLTAEQNILLPLELAGSPVDREWFDTLVETLGLGAAAGRTGRASCPAGSSSGSRSPGR